MSKIQEFAECMRGRQKWNSIEWMDEATNGKVERRNRLYLKEWKVCLFGGVIQRCLLFDNTLDP
jgi:hypothetical protein